MNRVRWFVLAMLLVPLGAQQSRASAEWDGACLCSSGVCHPSSNGVTWDNMGACTLNSAGGQVKVVSAHRIVRTASGTLLALPVVEDASPKYRLGGEIIDDRPEYLRFLSSREPPAVDSLTQRGFSVSLEYAGTDFSSRSTLQGQEREADDIGITAHYAKDYGEWGLMVTVPLRRQTNNGPFAALDNTSIGLAVMPTYHLLNQPVHGITLDVSAIGGFDLAYYDDRSALSSPTGSYAWAGFDHPASMQAGGLIHAAYLWRATLLRGQVGHIVNRNMNNAELFGGYGGLSVGGVGVTQFLSREWQLGLAYSQSRLSRIDAETVDRDFGEASLSLMYRDGRDAWGARLRRTVGNEDYTTSGIQLVFSRELN